MKVSISYPPLQSDEGTPLLSQNRQFQWYHNPTYIYPVVPAQAATLLAANGYEVSWDDGIAGGLDPAEYLDRMEQTRPDVIVIESKTPVIKRHWQIIKQLKERLPESRVVLVGDHVTALPGESIEQSPVDFVLTGGDYDFLLLNLCRHLTKGVELEPGIWLRQAGRVHSTGPFQQNHDLDTLPFIDRDLTQWHLYSEKNGNFKRTPGTYIMAGRDCWWHRCTFCSWTTTYPKFRVRTPAKFLDEIGSIIDKYPVKEVFDDTGTFPAGKWLREFCTGMIERGYSRRVVLGCNMRFGHLGADDFRLMKRAGFRYVLFGVESANQASLDRLKKGLKVQDIIEGARLASDAGLDPHLTLMVGYPWETKEDALATVDLARRLVEAGHVRTLQATIVIPYPGTPLHHECLDNGWLTTQDWDDYDMRQPVMKTSISEADVKELVQRMYKVFVSPRYAFRQLMAIRSPADLGFLLRGIKALGGHLRDFSKKSRQCSG